MTALGLDKDSHNISIVCRAPQQLVKTQIFYNSIHLLYDDDVDMIWAVIKRTPQFIAFNLYVTVEAVRFDVGEGSLHTSYENEHLQSYMDEAFDIAASRDVYEEFIDNDGVKDNPKFFDELQVEHNVDASPISDPTPKWFTANTWDNIHDPSPSMETCLTSWQEGDQPTKGMLLKNKASVQHALTMFSVKRNKKYKPIKSDFDRLVVSCVPDARLWLVQVICSKKHNLWKITTCKGLHTCSSLQVEPDGRMVDSKFISVTLETYMLEDISRMVPCLRSLLHVKHKHWVSHYKVWDAKQKAVTAIYGDFNESYAELPQFLAKLKDAGSSTMFKLNVDSRGVPRTSMFNCVFWAFGSCIEGFKHCRPMISIDATHLYGKYKVKQLIAMAMDGNNEDYPLALAVVESKSKETWGWSLACLTLYVMDQDHLCIISDKHYGIKSCFYDTSRTYLQPPKAYHWYYLHHLASNVNIKWKIPKLKNLVWKTASANQVRKFEATLELICNVKELAYEYLKLRTKKSGHLHMMTNADTGQ